MRPLNAMKNMNLEVSHDGDFCNVTFRKYILPPSSGLNSKTSNRVASKENKNVGIQNKVGFVRL
jgi:hypothetical protein